MAVHPSEDYLIYTMGSIIVVKSLLDMGVEFLKGHEGQICTLTVSKTGKLIGSGE